MPTDKEKQLEAVKQQSLAEQLRAIETAQADAQFARDFQAAQTFKTSKAPDSYQQRQDRTMTDVAAGRIQRDTTPAPTNMLGLSAGDTANPYQSFSSTTTAMMSAPVKLLWDTAWAAGTAIQNLGTTVTDTLKGEPTIYDMNPDAMFNDSLTMSGFMTGQGVGVNMAERGVIGGLTKPQSEMNISSIFGSRDIPKKDLLAFVKNKEAGLSPYENWQDTGIRQQHGQLIREFSDAGADFKPGVIETVTPKPMPKPKSGKKLPKSQDPEWTIKGIAEDVFDHPELYGSYPALRGIDVDISHVPPAGMPKRWQSKPQGYRAGSLLTDNLGRMTIKGVAGSPEAARALVIHEMQHAVQQLDNLPVGGSAMAWGNKDFWTEHQQDRASSMIKDMNQIVDDNNPHLMSSFDEWKNSVKQYTPELDGDLSALEAELFDGLSPDASEKLFFKMNEYVDLLGEQYPGGQHVYERLAGEVQARLAENRSRLTPEQGRRVPPMYDEQSTMKDFKEEFPDSQQIVQRDRPLKTNAEPPPIDEVAAARLKKLKAQAANDNTPNPSSDMTPEEALRTAEEVRRGLQMEEYKQTQKHVVDSWINVMYKDDKFFKNRISKNGMDHEAMYSAIDDAAAENWDALNRRLEAYRQGSSDGARIMVKFIEDLIEHFKGIQ